MRTAASLWANIRHWLLCRRHSSHLEYGDGEVFLRCATCWLRSPGLRPGPFRPVRVLPGDPARHQMLAPLATTVRTAEELPVGQLIDIVTGMEYHEARLGAGLSARTH